MLDSKAILTLALTTGTFKKCIQMLNHGGSRHGFVSWCILKTRDFMIPQFIWESMKLNPSILQRLQELPCFAFAQPNPRFRKIKLAFGWFSARKASCCRWIEFWWKETRFTKRMQSRNLLSPQTLTSFGKFA